MPSRSFRMPPLVTAWPKAALRGARVLVRVDWNVPLVDGRVGEGWRVTSSLPTIEYLARAGARVIILAHLGRPGGKRKVSLSLAPVAKFASRSARTPIEFLPAVTGPKVEKAVRELPPGHVLVLENLRFHPGEDKNDLAFARTLASYGDLYVDDAFGVAHRASASLVGLPSLLPSASGLLLHEELAILSTVRDRAKKPLVVLVGGKKLETKIGVLRHLSTQASFLLLGSLTSAPFFAAQGFSIGKTQIATEDIMRAKTFGKSKKLQLPVDLVVWSGKGPVRVSAPDDIQPNEAIYDIGPATVKKYSALLRKARTIVWNGPVGMNEDPRFSHGTRSIALLVGARARSRVYGVVGGGETVAAVRAAGVAPWMDWLSTGGGSMLTFLEGKELPAVAALLRSKKKIKTFYGSKKT